MEKKGKKKGDTLGKEREVNRNKETQRKVQSQLCWVRLSGSPTGHSWIDPPRTRHLGPGTYILPLSRGVFDLGCSAKIYRFDILPVPIDQLWLCGLDFRYAGFDDRYASNRLIACGIYNYIGLADLMGPVSIYFRPCLILGMKSWTLSPTNTPTHG